MGALGESLGEGKVASVVSSAGRQMGKGNRSGVLTTAEGSASCRICAIRGRGTGR